MDVPIGGNLSSRTDVEGGTSPHTCYPCFAGAAGGIGCASRGGKEGGERDFIPSMMLPWDSLRSLVAWLGGWHGKGGQSGFHVPLRAFVGVMGSLILRLHKSQAASSSQFIFLQFVSSSGGNCIYYNCL